MSLIDKINSVQAIALAGLERANNNVSMIQNIQYYNRSNLKFWFASQSPRVKHQSSKYLDLNLPFASPFYYAFDGVEESYPIIRFRHNSHNKDVG
jgi:hypothetical protein